MCFQHAKTQQKRQVLACRFSFFPRWNKLRTFLKNVRTNGKIMKNVCRSDPVSQLSPCCSPSWNGMEVWSRETWPFQSCVHRIFGTNTLAFGPQSFRGEMARTKFYVDLCGIFDPFPENSSNPFVHGHTGIPLSQGLCLFIMSSKYARAADVWSSFIFCSNLRCPGSKSSKSSFLNFPSFARTWGPRQEACSLAGHACLLASSLSEVVYLCLSARGRTGRSVQCPRSAMTSSCSWRV